VVEHNGDVYPCDFFVHPGWRLGNVVSDPLRAIVESDKRTGFADQKRRLPAGCGACEWKALCNGGCPRNRGTSEDGRQTPDYFCRSYRRFLAHADTRMRSLRDRLLRHGQQFQFIEAQRRPRPGRNDPCPCGSGRKHKVCCGDPALSQSYLFREAG
jgi:uncharacterized protein